MDKLLEGLDEDSNLSVREMKSRFLAYEAEKKKKEDDLQDQMAEMSVMLKNLSGETTSGVATPGSPTTKLIMTTLKILHPCLILTIVGMFTILMKLTFLFRNLLWSPIFAAAVWRCGRSLLMDT